MEGLEGDQKEEPTAEAEEERAGEEERDYTHRHHRYLYKDYVPTPIGRHSPS